MKKPAFNNFERIFTEIKKHAANLAPEYGVEPQEAVRSLMKIVELKDRDRIYRQRRINQEIEQVIKTTKRSSLAAGES